VFVLSIVVGVGVFLLLREFMCWYYKINNIVSLLSENNQLLRYANSLAEAALGQGTARPVTQSAPVAYAVPVAPIAAAPSAPSAPASDVAVRSAYEAWVADRANAAAYTRFMQLLNSSLSNSRYSSSWLLEQYPEAAGDEAFRRLVDAGRAR
jgi:hypothetical protein